LEKWLQNLISIANIFTDCRNQQFLNWKRNNKISIYIEESYACCRFVELSGSWWEYLLCPNLGALPCHLKVHEWTFSPRRNVTEAHRMHVYSPYLRWHLSKTRESVQYRYPVRLSDDDIRAWCPKFHIVYRTNLCFSFSWSETFEAYRYWRGIWLCPTWLSLRQKDYIFSVGCANSLFRNSLRVVWVHDETFGLMSDLLL